MSSTPPSEVPPVTGLIAGKYELVALIGRGGMGSVWEGRHNTLGTRVAIKFIEPEIASSGEARTRFETEARAAATIQSKHAIQIYDHGILADGRPYMVMELLSGEPLDKQLDRAGKMTVGQVARLIQQVSRALQRAHDAGITHRDLKPENIFLVRSPDDDEEIAKVLDFGIAKMKNSPGQGMDSGTRTGTLLGTPYYMSPEQARGLRSVDHRADLWALGVIAYRCVVGRLPFDGESIGDLLVNICTGPIPVPSAGAEGIPPQFDAWFAKACDRAPDARFQSAHELADSLLLAAGLSVRRGPGSLDPSHSSNRLSQSGDARAQGLANTPRPYVSPSGTPPKMVHGVTIDPVVGRPETLQRGTRPAVLASIAAVAVLAGLAVGTVGYMKMKGRSPEAEPRVGEHHLSGEGQSFGGTADSVKPDHVVDETAIQKRDVRPAAEEPTKGELPEKKKPVAAPEPPGKKTVPPHLEPPQKQIPDPTKKYTDPPVRPIDLPLPPVTRPTALPTQPPPPPPPPVKTNDPGY